MSTPLPYRAAAIEARRSGYAINVQAARDIEAALLDFANRLDKLLATLPANRRAAVELTARNVRDMATTLDDRIAAAVRKGVAVTFDDTLEAWAKATEKVGQAIGSVEGAAFGAVPVPSITEAHAFAATRRLGEPFRTLIRDDANLVATEVTTIIQKAIVDGVHPEKLARLLRPYVLGETGGTAALLPYLDAVPVDAKGAAFAMNHNAKRIAFTETHNARREAEVAHFVADPFIGLAQWVLSPNRGTQRTPDVCDALAFVDWYGLGAGIYPLAAVPTSPHPWDRCEVLPVTLTTATRAKLARFDGRRKLNPVDTPLPGEHLMTPNAAARTRRSLAELLVERVTVPPPRRAA